MRLGGIPDVEDKTARDRVMKGCGNRITMTGLCLGKYSTWLKRNSLSTRECRTMLSRGVPDGEPGLQGGAVHDRMPCSVIRAIPGWNAIFHLKIVENGQVSTHIYRSPKKWHML